jgi:SAM-dependent methyltransferase
MFARSRIAMWARTFAARFSTPMNIATPTHTARQIERGKFGNIVKDWPKKIQVGVRGAKIAPDWISIDKFDRSPLIDHPYDLHDLPFDDCSVDCYVCNAVLEHIFEPQLAIYEMWRTLKVGGMIWVEVPFLQFYHAHPHDFRRWTIPGLRWEMRRFKERACDFAGNISREVQPIAKALATESAAGPINPAYLRKIEATLDRYSESARLLRMYSGVFFWGEKISDERSTAEDAYMKELKAQVLKASEK